MSDERAPGQTPPVEPASAESASAATEQVQQAGTITSAAEGQTADPNAVLEEETVEDDDEDDEFDEDLEEEDDDDTVEGSEGSSAA